jgi:probable HAF family extracellular repeat protein
MTSQTASQRVGAIIFALSASVGATVGDAGVYSVKDLGLLTDLSGVSHSKPTAISNNGKVSEVNLSAGSYRAFLYEGIWTNLGTLGGDHSFGHGVDDSARVVGRAVTSSGANRAFLWTPGGTDGVASNPQMKDLGTFTGGTNSEANAINASGQVTGYAETSNRHHAFRYSGGTKTDIGVLLPVALPNSYGLSINDAGHVAGIAYDAAFAFSHAFFYNGATAVDIGNLGPLGASAMGVNNSDHIVGYAPSTAFYDHAFHYFGGVMKDLGTLGGNYSYANGVNNSSVIVGGSFVDADDTVYHAFVSDGNTMVDLNSLLDSSGAGWELVEARAINDSGQIVGVGQFDGGTHAFLLNPLPVITDLQHAGSDLKISFTTINTATYNLAGSDNLAVGSWNSVITGIVGNGGVVTVSTGTGDQPRQFYRIALANP